LATILNEVAKSTRLGIVLEEEQIPVRQQVMGACELLGLDPLFVANEGIFAAMVQASVAEDCLDLLRNDFGWKEACIIGKATTEHPGKVVVRSPIGGRRVVNMLPGDQLPRIC
jgi:hydrogenase expression/formation protein HypE